MKPFRILFLSLILATLSIAANPSLTKELYTVSGLKEQVLLLAPTLKYQIEQAQSQDATLKQLPASFMQKITQLVENAFDANTLQAVILDHLSQRMSERQIKEVIAWYRSPLGKKCVVLEAKSSTINGMEEVIVYAQKIQNHPLSAKRVALLQKFSKAIDFSEYTKTLAMDAGVTMYMALMSSMPPEQRPTIFQVRNQLKAQLEQNQAQFDSDTFVSLAYTYEKLSDEEIQSYIDFAKTAAGDAYMKASLEALSSAIGEGSKKL